MNTKQMYVFQDSISGNYSDTFTANTVSEAIRIFARSLSMAHLPERYRDDLILKHLGEITCDDNGEIYVRGFEVARHVLRGSASEIAAELAALDKEAEDAFYKEHDEEEVSGDVEVTEE